MPHSAQHHRQMFLARTPSRARRLALGMCLAASLALSACGPAHKGQLSVEPAGASAEASASDPEPSETPRPTSSKTPSATPSTAATWSPPSVTFTNEDTSVWSRNDDLANTSKNSDTIHIEGYQFTNGQVCQGYISQYVSEEYFTPHPIDGLQSMTDVSLKTDDYTAYQTTGAASPVEAVRDDNGTMPGYEVGFSGSVNFSNAPNTPVVGYRFSRTVGKEGYVLNVGLVCQTDTPASLEQWHTILAGIRVKGIDAGAM